MIQFRAAGTRGERAGAKALAWLVGIGLLLCICLSPRHAIAQRLRAEDVPPDLAPWTEWVLDRARDEGCRTIDTETVCAWSSELALDLDEHGGTFTMRVLVNFDTSVALPGSLEAWPTTVESGGKPLIVTERDGGPVVRLSPGSHDLRGRFTWSRFPNSLSVPPRVAVVVLRVFGKEVPFPDRRNGQVLLDIGLRDGEAGTPSGEGTAEAARDDVSLQVARRLDDGVPLQVTTHLRLRVSGRGREVNLGKVLVDGSTALKLSAGVPAHLTDAGILIARVQPGTHEITLIAHVDKPLDKLVAPKFDASWPDHEIWAWAPAPAIREVELSGAPAVDPSRTDIPDAWKSLTAFKLRPGRTLTFETKRRGVSEPAPNRLTLVRELRLDGDGSGWSVKDHIGGQIARRWRLDLREGTLGRAVVDGQDQLITRSKAAPHAGVELRRGEVNVDAEWRLGSTRRLPAVAWSEDFESVFTTVHLPPGWELVHATGADSVSSPRADRLDLVRILLILGIALAVAKLLRPRWGVLAGVALLLAVERAFVPTVSLMVFLLMMALTVVLPEGRIRRIVRVGRTLAAIGLVAVVVQFSARELRDALYPQAERDTSEDMLHGYGLVPAVAVGTDDADDAPMAAAPVEQEAAPPAAAKRGADVSQFQSGLQKTKPAVPEAMGAAPSKPDGVVPEAQDPNIVIQSGEGTPTWQFRSWQLEWRNPVGQSHQVHLWLVSPLGNAVLAGLRVALFIALTYLLIRDSSRRSPRKPLPTGAAKAVSTATVLLAAGTWSSPAAAAPPPSPELLEELKSRLTRPPMLAPVPECAPKCISVSRLDVLVENKTLTLKAEVHAAGPDVYKLPGPATSWVPRSVEVDGRPTRALALLPDGALRLRLDAGRFVVQMRGPITGTSLTLDPGTLPKHVAVVSRGYRVDGVDENGRAAGSLQITATTPEETVGTAGELPSVHDMPTWLRVSRTLDIGVVWTVTTRVERLSPGTSPLMVRIPLLSGERVTAAGISVEKNEAVVSLGPMSDGDAGAASSVVEWSGVLSPTDSVKLTAAPDTPWTEQWTLRCGTVWRCSPDGLAPIEEVSGGVWAPVYLPWPGESLSIAFRRPDAMPGKSVTIDGATLKLSPDPRQSRATLELTARSSSLGSETIRLPQGAIVEELQVDDVRRSTPANERTVSVQLKPGTQRIVVRWREERAIGTIFRSPEVSLGRSAVDARVEITVPHDRWILHAGGPRVGPAVLFWGYLALLVLLGTSVALVVKTPLRPWQAALLAAGLTQLEPWHAVIVGSWFVLFALRRTATSKSAFAFLAKQLLLALWTLAAMAILGIAAVRGLLDAPDMGLAPPEYAGYSGSDRVLSFYVDRTTEAMPEPWIITAPLWVWKALNLGWVLWLLASSRTWLRWGWDAFTTNGVWGRRSRSGLGHGPEAAPAAEGVPPPRAPSGGDEPQGAPPGAE